MGDYLFSKGGIRSNAWAGLKALAVVTVLAVAVAVAPTEAAAEKYASFIIDAKTGKTLFARNADAKRYPASLTKMMTLFLTFEALERGEITMDTRWRVSAQAAAQAPSKLGLKVNSTIAVKDAIMALITKSANDVAVVTAEGLAGSEQAFARRMTERARQIGMTNTTFRNASGLPNSGQVTTARDMATLGRTLQDTFPKYFDMFSSRSYSINGRRYGNHNRLLGKVKGVDGIKTGYTRASGFNLVASVNRDNRSIVAVVMGGRTARSRDDHMTDIIGTYFRKASTGPRTAPMLVANQSGANPFRVALDSAPLPRPRPGIGIDAEPFAVAAAQPEDDTDPIDELVRMAEGDTDEGDDAAAEPLNRVAMTFAAVEPAPGIFPLPRALPDVAAPEKPQDSAVVLDGWKIQVGALPTEGGAMERLDRARNAMPKLLGELSPYTEPVKSGSTTLYRARFAGFADKDAARDACHKLSREDIECIALR